MCPQIYPVPKLQLAVVNRNHNLYQRDTTPGVISYLRARVLLIQTAILLRAHQTCAPWPAPILRYSRYLCQANYVKQTEHTTTGDIQRRSRLRDVRGRVSDPRSPDTDFAVEG